MLRTTRSTSTKACATAIRPVAVSLVACLILTGVPALASAQYVFVPSPPPCGDGIGLATPRADSQPAARSVALITFEVPAGNAADQYLADALPDALGGRLSRGGLDVLNRGVVRVVRPRERREIVRAGGTLGVRWIVTGSLTGSADRRVITISLLDASFGTEVWSAEWAASTTLADVESASALAIVSRIRPTVDAATRSAVAAPRTSNPAAFDALLRGIDHALDGAPVDLSRAIDDFAESGRLDPDFALPRARSALAASDMLDYARRVDPDAATRLEARARTEANAAVALDSTLAIGWLAVGDVASHRADGRRDADRAFARALHLDPASPLVHERRGLALMRMGDRAAGEAELRRAASLAPGRARARIELAELAARAGRTDSACALLNAAIAAEPYVAWAYVLRADVRARMGELRHAWSDAEIAERLGAATLGKAVSALVDAAARDTARARDRANALYRDVTSGSSISAREGRYVARVLLALGRRDDAMDVLERVRPVGPALAATLGDPAFISLHSSPRFRQLQRAAHTTATRGSAAAAAGGRP
ncbi:MAG TPA: tetratricopeptide repeat protein [Gemmatimonadaceae bacterium]|nr:tetratricopeptide repeat protein [Gemmatimonadaceae bacterium]